MKIKKKQVYKYSWELFKYALKFSKGFFWWKLGWILLKALKTILVDVWLLKFVLDAIVTGKTFKETICFIMICAIICFAEMYIDDWINVYVQPVAKNKVHKSVYQMIFKKICEVDLEKFDNTKFYDKYIWNLENASNQMFSCFENYMKLISSVISVILMFVLLFTVNPIVIFFAVIPMFFVFKLGKRTNKLDFECDTEINTVNRRKNYSRRVFYLKEFAQDIRSSEIKNVMLDNFLNSANEEINIQKKYSVPKMVITMVKDSSYGLAQMLGLYLYITYKAIVEKSFTVGTCAAIINAVDRLTGYFYQLSTMILQIQKNGLYANEFFDFLNCENLIETSTDSVLSVPMFDSLRMENLSFKYYGSNNYVLKDINLSIHRGEKIAIVGLNGAGKSTLIKLILRFYDPQEGHVLYNGQDIRLYDVRNYRKGFSTIFQNFQIYATSLMENITMSKGYQETEQRRAYDCLKKANLDIEYSRLADNVTREFDKNGLEFSGGQKQKIAIARSIYSDADFIIMDEASAALDPISESEINQLMLDTMSDKTILIITHRLTTVKYVDKIYFLENGSIVECGTHKELVKLKGKYAEMFQTQAAQYSKED